MSRPDRFGSSWMSPQVKIRDRWFPDWIVCGLALSIAVPWAIGNLPLRFNDLQSALTSVTVIAVAPALIWISLYRFYCSLRIRKELLARKKRIELYRVIKG